MENKIKNMFNIKYPIIQGAMAWISDSSLASAVSNAGGLGIIASGNSSPKYVRDEIKRAKKLTDKPFGLNIMMLSPYVDEIAKIAIDEKVSFVTTGAGNPSKYIDMWKDAGIKVIPVVPNVSIAKKMERVGVDAIIAEGLEAGGHIGKMTTMSLIPQVVDAVNIPVIAAGGIADKRGIAASFMLGAEAVQVGTRFLVANECTVHQNYKDEIIKSKDSDTVETGKCTGHPVRVIKNELANEMLKIERENINSEAVKDIDELGKGALYKAVKEGDIKKGAIMAGQIAGLINKEQTVEEIIKEMFDGIEELSNVLKNKM